MASHSPNLSVPPRTNRHPAALYPDAQPTDGAAERWSISWFGTASPRPLGNGGHGQRQHDTHRGRAPGKPGQEQGNRGRSGAAVLSSPGRHQGAAGGLPRASGAELSDGTAASHGPEPHLCPRPSPPQPPSGSRPPASASGSPSSGVPPAQPLLGPAGGLRPLAPSLTPEPGRASAARGRRLAPRKRSWCGCCAFPRRRPASSPPLPSPFKSSCTSRSLLPALTQGPGGAQRAGGRPAPRGGSAPGSTKPSERKEGAVAGSV